MRGDFLRFIETLRSRRVFIQTHNFPDPDAIASAWGLKEILRHFGVVATLCYKGSIDNEGLQYVLQEYDIPIFESSRFSDMEMTDKIILVDGQKHNANMTDLPGAEVACIDHHPDNEKVELEYEDIRPCGACASLITEYYRQLDVPLDRKIATLLLYGLQMDTDNLRRGVANLDVEAFRQLFSLADNDMLRKLAGRNMRGKDLRAFGTAIENIAVYDNVGIAFIPFACDDYLIAQVADFMLAISEVDTAIVYAQRNNGLKFSARTLLPEIHCGNLLQKCLGPEGGNGGGHPHMAGGFLPKDHVLPLYENGNSWENTRRSSLDFREHLASRIVDFVAAANKQAG